MTAGGVTKTQKGEVILILHQYAYVGKSAFIHSSAQIEAYKNHVDDRAIVVVPVIYPLLFLYLFEHPHLLRCSGIRLGMIHFKNFFIHLKSHIFSDARGPRGEATILLGSLYLEGKAGWAGWEFLKVDNGRGRGLINSGNVRYEKSPYQRWPGQGAL